MGRHSSWPWWWCCWMCLGLTAVQLVDGVLADSDASDDGVRLPTIAAPSSYRLTLLPIMDGPHQRLCGHVRLIFEALRPSTRLILHAFDLRVLEAVYRPLADEDSPEEGQEAAADQRRVSHLCHVGVFEAANGTSGRKIESIDYDETRQRMTLTLPTGQAFQTGQRYHLGLLYLGQIYDTSIGFYRSLDRLDGCCCKKWVGATQMEPVNARRVFPCVDEPESKTTFEVVIGHTNDTKALSNMPLIRTKPMVGSSGKAWSFFETTPPMSTYLVACVLLPSYYTNVEMQHQNSKGTVTIGLWSRPADVYRLRLAASLSLKMMSFVEDYLDEPYALPKIDMVPLPTLPNFMAMENWGLVVYGDQFLFNEGSTFDETVARTIAHEVAHQWLGNLVTIRWWDELWVAEGLASYFEGFMLKELDLDSSYELAMQVNYQQVLSSDIVNASRALLCDVDVNQDINKIFDIKAYIKGAALMKMARNFLGDETFRKGLRTYVQRYKFGTASHRQFWAAMGGPTDRSKSRTHSLNSMMKTWTTQEGYPVVHCRRTANGSRILLHQEPFVATGATLLSRTTLDEAAAAAARPQRCRNVAASGRPVWWIPVSLTNSQSVKCNLRRPSLVWLSPRNPSVELISPVAADRWILANFEFGGYFRVNYDEHNWQLLAEQLIRDHAVIPAVSRSQLLDDAFALAHYGVISYTTPLVLIQYISHESEAAIRDNVLGHLNLALSNSVQQEEQLLIQEAISNMQGDAQRRFDVSRSEFSQVACANEKLPCRNESLRLYRGAMEGTLTPVERRIVLDNIEVVSCTSISWGGKAEWDYAWRQSVRNDRLEERTTLLVAMACTRDADHQKRLLSRILGADSSHMESKDVPYVLRALAANPTARPIVLQFVLNSWELLFKQLGDISATEILYDIIKTTSKAVEEQKYDRDDADFNEISETEKTVVSGYSSNKENLFV